MIPFILIGAIAAAIRRSQIAPAIDVPQFRGGGVDQNAVAAPQPIVPLALADRYYPGPAPASRGIPTLPAIPDLSELTAMDQIMAWPDEAGFTAPQIEPLEVQDTLNYGPVQ
jgi:hypothetical protein